MFENIYEWTRFGYNGEVIGTELTKSQSFANVNICTHRVVIYHLRNQTKIEMSKQQGRYSYARKLQYWSQNKDAQSFERKCCCLNAANPKKFNGSMQEESQSQDSALHWVHFL